MNKDKNVAVSEQKSDTRKTGLGLAGISWIVYIFDKLSEIIYTALVNGFFGYIFTSYSKELDAYQNSYFVSYFKGGSRTRRVLRKIREYLSRNFEGSFILRKIRRFVCKLAFVPLKSYGSFLLSFGIYTILVYFIKLLLPAMGLANIDYLYIGIGTCIVSLPIYLSSATLAEAVRKSKSTSAIFVDVFGYREDNFENKYSKQPPRTGLSVFFGFVAGILTFVFNPLYIIGILPVTVIAALVITVPEIGVIVCIFFLPFLSFFENPTLALTLLVLLTAFSYVIKLIRGKRIFKLGLLDFVVLTFLLLVAFSGIVTVGGVNSHYASMVSCSLMLGYFIIVNLIRTSAWLKRCVIAFVTSGTAVALIGVLQYILGLSPSGWIDTSYFSDIQGRTTALFENPNYLAAYLVLVFPFALYCLITATERKNRILTFICCSLIVICTVFTWSRGAWLAMIISTLVMLLLFTKKTMRLFYSAVFIVPFLPFVLPDNIVRRFMSIGDIADSSTMYRIYTWRGCGNLIRDYFWGGIGYGTDAFEKVYPIYAYVGMESAVHSHSLYLQIMISMGIAGLLCFGMVVLFYVQKCFEYLKTPVSNKSYVMTAASLASFVGLLIMGLFDYIWYNYRIFFVFWTVMAFGVACVRIGKNEKARAATVQDSNDCAATLDVKI